MGEGGIGADGLALAASAGAELAADAAGAAVSKLWCGAAVSNLQAPVLEATAAPGKARIGEDTVGEEAEPCSYKGTRQS